MLLDRALGEEAGDLWTAIAVRVRRIERTGRHRTLGRGEAVVACAALAGSGADRAKTLCADLVNEVKDPVLLRVLASGDQTTPEEVRLEGEMLPGPRGPVATTILALTGLLFVMHALGLIARREVDGVLVAVQKPDPRAIESLKTACAAANIFLLRFQWGLQDLMADPAGGSAFDPSELGQEPVEDARP
jgi:hypothetical protein